MSIERIKKNITIDENTGCWLWKGTKTGKTNLKSYGKLTIGSREDNSRKNVLAHRYSYSLFKGDIPKGMFICHKCDVPACVNPDHLFAGTRQDNVDDRERKNRNNHYFGEKAPGAKLNPQKVKDTYNKYKKGGYTHRSLANEYGVNKSTIRDILVGNTWGYLFNTTPPKTSKQ